MKSYEEFLIEYTNAQLAQGGTSSQRAIAQTRQRKREEEQRQKERDQKRLGSALARRSGSTAITRPKGGALATTSSSALGRLKGGPLATRSSAISKRTPNSSAIVPSSSRKEPTPSKIPDERRNVGKRTEMPRVVKPNKDDKEEQKKKRCKFGQVRIAGKCRGLPKPPIRGSDLKDTGEARSADLDGLEVRNSLQKVD